MCPGREDIHDDMINDAYVVCATYAPRFDPVHGVPFWLWVKPIVIHTMRRRMRREVASSMCTWYNIVARGEATDNRHRFDAEAHPEGVESLPDQTPSPDALVERVDDVWRMRRAIWQAAEEMKVAASDWRYAMLRDVILTDRGTYREIQKRYDKRSGSLNFFRDRLLRRAKELVS
jgi:hypothetical protein